MLSLWIALMTSAVALAAGTPTKARPGASRAKPAKAAAAAPSIPAQPQDSGNDRYTPTKCEWLALELNTYFRETKPGYSSQFYCRPPNTIFLSFKYKTDADREAVSEASDTIRESIGRVLRDRGWKWAKVDEEVVKFDTAATVPASGKKAVVPAKAEPAGESESTVTDEVVKPQEMEKLENAEQFQAPEEFEAQDKIKPSDTSDEKPEGKPAKPAPAQQPTEETEP